jgi:hypothetical protein
MLICKLSCEIMITSQKTNQNKLWRLVFNQHNVERWNWKKIIQKYKKNLSHPELTPNKKKIRINDES